MDEIETLVEVYRDDTFQAPKSDTESDDTESGEIKTPPETPVPIESEPVGYDPREKHLGGRAGSIRVIVTRCRISSGLDTGSLHLITIDGCTIGSAGIFMHFLSKFLNRFFYKDGNDLQINADDVDPFHCWISYSTQRGFLLTTNAPVQILKHPDFEDYATLLESGVELEVKHECSLEIGYTILELHLHPPAALGQSETCDGCEPGLRKAEILRQSRLNMPTRETSRKGAQKEMRKICGVTNQRRDNKEVKSRRDDYRDRAAERREKYGVDAPYSNDPAASVSTEIPKGNIGRKLMEKAGWKSGQGLGKTKQGIVEPIAETSTRRPGDQTGMGAAESQKPVTNRKTEKKNKILLKTAQRYYSSNAP